MNSQSHSFQTTSCFEI